MHLSRADAEVLNCNLDDSILGFHAQQAIEKALKALLTQLEIPYEKIHDLEELQELVATGGLNLPATPLSLSRLTDFAVFYRYERGDTGDFHDIALLRQTVEIIFNFVLEKVDIEGRQPRLHFHS